jgi:hypothetical protein
MDECVTDSQKEESRVNVKGWKGIRTEDCAIMSHRARFHQAATASLTIRASGARGRSWWKRAGDSEWLPHWPIRFAAAGCEESVLSILLAFPLLDLWQATIGSE